MLWLATTSTVSAGCPLVYFKACQEGGERRSEDLQFARADEGKVLQSVEKEACADLGVALQH